ncbi:hypothetical protein LY78DRAFT_683517 [Colletotrichum sublineola]|uniref:Uncharacterized protein n=1 Tax=Colletotrichum sublineola TaxID=1173701 RepID=A0A066X5B1_COLSU|nr:hypothetical protein LY78DRAFT_683517 [Colletotrichum sublineola]KDN60946.1 hypothetical protein CSUB01_07315 [Colletotrichum sublineola]
MAFPTLQDFGDLQPLAELMARASDPVQTATVAQELAASDGPITAAAGSSPIDELRDQLTDAAQGPANQVDNGRAPMPQDVPVMPPKSPDNPMTDEAHVRKALEDFGHLRDITSIADLFIAMSNITKRTKRGHPEPYLITDAAEAAQAMADMADSAYNVMLSPPLTGLYSFGSGTQTTFSRRMSKTELHLGFLAEIFKGFSLTDAAKKQLDGILTNFIKSLQNISVSSEKTSNTVDETIRIHQTIATNITGSSEHPIWVYQPRTRIVYMHIDGSTWKWATNKANHESSTFNMRYVVVDFDLNVNRWLAAKTQLEAIFKKTAGLSFNDYGKIKFPSPVDADAK